MEPDADPGHHQSDVVLHHNLDAVRDGHDHVVALADREDQILAVNASPTEWRGGAGHES